VYDGSSQQAKKPGVRRTFLTFWAVAILLVIYREVFSLNPINRGSVRSSNTGRGSGMTIVISITP